MDTSITFRARTDRPNVNLSGTVDQALAMAEEQGTWASADFLIQCGAGFALTCRVLAEPERRRTRPVDPLPTAN